MKEIEAEHANELDALYGSTAKRRASSGLVVAASAPTAPAGRAQTPSPETTLRDCPDCPELVMIPAETFQMGSPQSEEGRHENEGPVHTVHIAGFAAGKYPITRGQWRQFVMATGRQKSSCVNGDDWENPQYFQDHDFAQEDDHPVVCITWQDANDYAAWMTQKAGHHYRLLSEAEYEYVNRAGTTTQYFWGDSESDLCRYANGGKTRFCRSDFTYTSPVGHFLPNKFGLYDTTGNVWEWTQDCYNNSYDEVPTDGRAWVSENCRGRVVRGGSWFNFGAPSRFRAAYRDTFEVATDSVGFRVARAP